MHFLYISSWYRKRRPRKYLTYSTTTVAQIPIDLLRALKKRKGYSYVLFFFFPTSPPSSNPYSSWKWIKSDKQKKKRNMSPIMSPMYMIWLSRRQVALSNICVCWLLKSHFFKRKTHIQICDQIKGEHNSFTKGAGGGLSFSCKNLLAASHWSASIALSPYSFSTPILPKSGPKSLLSFSSWRISWNALL